MKRKGWFLIDKYLVYYSHGRHQRICCKKRLPMLNIMYYLEGWCEQPSLVYRSMTLPTESPQAVFNIIELPTISSPEPDIHIFTFFFTLVKRRFTHPTMYSHPLPRKASFP